MGESSTLSLLGPSDLNTLLCGGHKLESAHNNANEGALAPLCSSDESCLSCEGDEPRPAAVPAKSSGT